MLNRNPSLFLLIVSALFAGIGFLVYSSTESLISLIMLFTGVILGGTVLIFKKEINLWVNQRSAKSLSVKEQQYLQENFRLMEHIPATLRPLFFKKVQLFILDKEIISQDPSEKIYHPAVLICAAYASFFEMKKHSIKAPFAHIPVYVFYGHAFPSPQFPKNLHISEYYEEDGALLFSVPHMIKGNEDPSRFLNIALYESARVAANGNFESVEFPSLEKLCRFGGFTLAKMEEYLGLQKEYISNKALAIAHFFTYTKRFQGEFPNIALLFQEEYLDFSKMDR